MHVGNIFTYEEFVVVLLESISNEQAQSLRRTERIVAYELIMRSQENGRIR